MTAGSAAAALQPVAVRLRRDAEDQAAGIRAQAQAAAADILEQARREAAAITDRAAATARADAAPLASAELRQAREAARSAVLGAQREACDQLRRTVHAAVAALPGQAGYGQLRDRIAALAEHAAGSGARIIPDPDGGMLARSPGLIVDCSLGRLADLAVAQLGAAISELWAAP